MPKRRRILWGTRECCEDCREEAGHFPSRGRSGEAASNARLLKELDGGEPEPAANRQAERVIEALQQPKAGGTSTRRCCAD